MRGSTQVGIAFLVAATLGGCAQSSPTVIVSGDVQVQPQVVLQDAIPGTLSGDAYEIRVPPRLSADTLIVTVQYGGGCVRHDFSLHASRAFMESNPVQSLVVLRHVSHGDMCRALLTRELRFDLGPLRRAYLQGYQATRGVIVLRLRGFAEGVRYEF